MYSDVLATIALVVSLATAAWTAYRAIRWSRPVISVSGVQSINGHSQAPDRKFVGFSIEIANTGDHATQIIKAYWQIDVGDAGEHRLMASDAVKRIEGSKWALVLQSDKPAPPFPFTIERYESREWEWEIPWENLRRYDNARRARPVVEYMTRKKRTRAYGPWEPSQQRLEVERLRRESATSAVTDDDLPPRVET